MVNKIPSWSLKKIREYLLNRELPIPDELLLALEEDSRKGMRTILKQYNKKLKQKEAINKQTEALRKKEKELYGAGYYAIAGVDEAGRGPLAGPVVAGAVIMKRNGALLPVRDSKTLSHAKREALRQQIKTEALAYAIGIASVHEIEQLNILEATKLAMKRALGNLRQPFDYLLTDVVHLSQISCPQENIVKGDKQVYAIAAASILAKEYRDELMQLYNRLYPAYGFHKNKGYGTAAHLKAVKTYGLSPIHRRTFKPIQDSL